MCLPRVVNMIEWCCFYYSICNFLEVFLKALFTVYVSSTFWCTRVYVFRRKGFTPDQVPRQTMCASFDVLCYPLICVLITCFHIYHFKCSDRHIWCTFVSAARWCGKCLVCIWIHHCIRITCYICTADTRASQEKKHKPCAFWRSLCTEVKRSFSRKYWVASSANFSHVP